MKPYSLKPDAMSCQIMGRINVIESDETALLTWAKSLKDLETTDRRWLFYAAARAIIQHRRNRAEYRYIMGGLK